MGQSHSSSSSPSRPSLTKTQSLFLSLSKTLPPLSLRDYNSIFSSLAETNDIGVPTYWKEDTFTQFLKVPPRAGSLLFKSARYLAALPNLEDSPASLDLEGLGVAVMVYTQRIPTEVLTHQEVNRVLFNSFAETPPKAEPSSKESEKEIPHGKYSPYISLSAMNEIILFLLSITTSESFTSSESAPASTDPLDRHVVAQSAKSILSAIRSYSKTLTEPIYYDAFRAFLERDAPYFFDPLVPLFQKFLYDKQKWGGKPLALEGWTEGLQVEMYTKTMNVAVVAQLSTFFPKEKRLGKLVCLYAGSKNGFSMGMFETKVLKYPGPSVLLLRGTKHPVSENGENLVLFGVYLQTPWKSSTKGVRSYDETDFRKLWRHVFHIVSVVPHAHDIPCRSIPHPIRLLPSSDRDRLWLPPANSPPSQVSPKRDSDPTYLRPTSFLVLRLRTRTRCILSYPARKLLPV